MGAQSAISFHRCSEGGTVLEVLPGAETTRVVDTKDDLDVAIDSPAIRRLVEEVRMEETGVPRSYNRTFNRHNR